MDNAAFTRAKRFLNYVPVAKWLSILCGVATAILYVGLLLVLALYADLLVNRGEIPAMHNLPAREYEQFLEKISLPQDEASRKTRIDEYQQSLKKLGLEEPPWQQLVAA